VNTGSVYRAEDGERKRHRDVSTAELASQNTPATSTTNLIVAVKLGIVADSKEFRPKHINTDLTVIFRVKLGKLL